MTDQSAQSIVILTGAGISKESGLDTFRDADGIWAKHDPDEVATIDAYRRDPDKVLDFYNKRVKGLVSDNIRPNAAHDALARLERGWPGTVLIVTQNVDNLHERAGSENLVHMHGEVAKLRCTCPAEIIMDWTDVLPWEADLTTATACPKCGLTGKMRPHVVWFGEMPFEMERIYAALDGCDLFLSIGTSGNVYPAAGFVQQVALGRRAHTVELNLEPSEGANLFAETVHGPATEVVPAYVDRLLAEGLRR
ncbi:MAG: NAD-dependent deacylase [Alphaproteobacteria bacterium]